MANETTPKAYGRCMTTLHFPLRRCIHNNLEHSDFADEYPEAEVIGTDISPIQPSWVPPNLRL